MDWITGDISADYYPEGTDTHMNTSKVAGGMR